MNEPQQLTVKEYAAVERVNDRTVWRWIAKGAVPIRRTPGGGVRVLLVPCSLSSSDNPGHPSK